MQRAIMRPLMMPVPCESRICDVTVYARGAVVTREVVIPSTLADGQVDLLVGGLTPLLQVASVQATIVASERRVVGLRCEVTSAEQSAKSYGSEASSDSSSDGSSDGFSDFEAHLAQLERNVEQIVAWKSSLVKQRRDLSEMCVVPKKERSFRRNPVQRIGDGLGASRVIDELTAEIDAELARVERELQRARQQRDDARVATRHVSLAHDVARKDRLSQVTVRLQGVGPVQSLRISYVVKAARWWPVYTLRLQHPNMTGQWAIEALVAQYSGEDWNDVAISLCTANLVDDVRLPKLPSLRLGRATPEVRSGYRPAPQDLDRMFQGFDRAFEGKLRAKYVPSPDEVDGREHADVLAPRVSEQVDGHPDVSADYDRDSDVDYCRDAEERSVDKAKERTLARAVASGAMRESVKFARKMAPMVMSAPGAVPLAAPSAMAYQTRARMSMRAPMPEETPAQEGVFDDAQDRRSGGPDFDDRRAMQPDDAWLDFNGLRLISGAAQGADQSSRGRLRRRDDEVVAREQREAVSKLEKVSPTNGVQDPLYSRGSFDHCYRAQATSDVQSDALVHRVPIVTAEVQTESVYRATPLISPEVYRELIIKNPFGFPMLDGPGEVFVDGSLVATTELGRIDRGGMMRVGIGVEERIRVARNVTVNETTSGLFGGTTCVSHEVRIELRSSLGSDVSVEVLDRIPDTDDKDIEIERTKASHELIPYTQQERGDPIRGGVSINVELPAGQTQTVLYGYVINLPSKNEIVGGNRRD